MTIQQALSSSSGINWINTTSNTTPVPSSGSKRIAKDIAGNIYSAVYENSSQQKLAINKVDTLGNIIWTSTPISTTDTFSFSSITIDSSNNVYMSGSKTGSGNEQLLVSKWNSSGAFQWANLYELTSVGLKAGEIISDSSGNIYVSAGFNGGSPTSSTGFTFLLKLNSSGTILWSTGLAGSGTRGQARTQAIDLDSSGNVYVAGYAEDVGTGIELPILLKYNSSGTQQWKRRFTYTAGSQQRFTTLTIDSNDNIYVGGTFYSTNYYNKLAKYNTSGTLQNYITYDSFSTNNDIYSLNCDVNGDIYIGHLQGQINSLTPSLTLNWANNISNISGTSVLAGNTRNIYVCGGPRVFNLPNNGTKTGTYSSNVYSTSTFTLVTATVTDEAAVLVNISPSFTTTAYSTTSTISVTASVTYI
jgi:hypothetical protein